MKNSFYFLIIIGFIISCKTIDKTKNSTSEKFYWANDTINGKYIEKAAMFVPFNINDLRKGLFAQFDLGSNVTIIYQNNLKEIPELNSLKLDSLNYQNEQGKELFIIKKSNIQIGQIQLDTLDIYGIYDYGKKFTPDTNNSPQDNSIGTIGSDILQDKVLIIDFPNQKITILDSIDEKIKSNFSLVKSKLINNRIIVPFNINGDLKHFMYDTGASLFPMVTTKSIWNYSTNKKIIDSLNVGNFGRPIKLKGAKATIVINIDKKNFNSFNIYYVKDNLFDKMFTQIGCDGIIGNKLFFDKKILIDYKENIFGVSN
ncbi:MAG: hypothetical protein HWD85_05345 [Flavobacteriaceae bacterium]|nr:hypothetical protein [Flavobacteriaceae bacterium]